MSEVTTWNKAKEKSVARACVRGFALFPTVLRCIYILRCSCV